MKPDLRNNRDFLTGLLLIGTGAGAFYMALDYPFGSTLRMGPGYFPRVLAGIIITFGFFVLVRGLRSNERVKGKWGWKALAFMVFALVAFGFIMDRFGLIPALAALFFVAAMGGHEFKWVEVALLTLSMSIFAVGVFVYGLGLPYRLFWWQ